MIELVAGCHTLALSTVLPPIASMCKGKDESIRERVTVVYLLAVVTGPAPASCPFVRLDVALSHHTSIVASFIDGSDKPLCSSIANQSCDIGYWQVDSMIININYS